MIPRDDEMERQVELFREFIDHYEASETKDAVQVFCRGLFGVRRADA